MHKSIEKLLSLADEFPIRKRIDYERNEDRVFCNEVLRAVKDAAPIIRQTFWEPPTNGMTVEQMLSNPTTQSAVPETLSPIPSNAASPEPETAHSTHTPTEPLKTGGTGADVDRKSDTVGKPLTGLAKLNAARKAAALARKQQSAKPSGAGPSGSETAPPPPQPPTTP